MKKEYQKMMGQVSLSDHARNDLLEKLESKTAKRKIRPLRTAVIAACVCLALVSSVFAAGRLSGVWMGEQVSNEDEAYYRVEADLGQWSMEDMSQALQADLAAGTLKRTYHSRAELEEYLGISLIHSAALEEAGIVEDLEASFRYGWDLRPELAADPNARYVLTGTDLDGEEMSGVPEVLKVTAHRVMENTEIYIDARIITESIDPEALKQGLLGEEFKPVTMLDHQVLFDENGNAYWQTTEYTSAEQEFTTAGYMMPNGIEATIVTAETVELWMKDEERSARTTGDGFREYAAYFVYDGVLYTVRPYAVYDPSLGFPSSDHDMLTVLKRVLDTFE